MRLLKKLILLLFIPFSYCSAQDSATAAGSHFKISGSRTFWMGKNYRLEWNTPVKAPVINLATEYGGLTPVKRGGGKQTKSLRVKDASGREYNFRSIQKFITSKTMPLDLQSEFAEDLVSDGISASYPYAALSIPVFAEAAGIPYNKVRLVYIPDDPRLGEFQKEFGNMLAFLEERIPESVKKGYDTDEVADKLKDDNDNEVDQLALLKIRILDMFVMDLDRHEDQWTWGAIEKDKGKIYFPIAKDRDQAFYTNEGVLPTIASWPWLVPQLEGFKAEARNIKRFNFAARNVDRFFLNQLTEEQWKKTTEDFLSKMTDAVIEKALAQQPKEIYAFSAPDIIQTLKARRNNLLAEVMEYYKWLSETVTVTASDKHEQFVINRQNDGSVLLVVNKTSKEGEISNRIYERMFKSDVTEELRLFGFDGNDQFIVNGNNDKIKVRMIGGPGEDKFESKTTSGDGGIVYDSTGENNTITGRFNRKLGNDSLVNSYNRIGYKYNTVAPFFVIGFNSDDGLFLGLSFKITRQGFRKTPYKNLHEISISSAFSTQAFRFHYNAEFISVLSRNTDLLFDADIKAPNNTTNFFGYGMNTVYVKTSPEKFKFYRARYELGDISLMLRQNFSEKFKIAFGPSFQFYSMDSTDDKNKIRNIVLSPPAGFNPATAFTNQSYFGGKLMVDLDLRNNRVLPQRGILWQTQLRHLGGLNNTPYSVTQLNSDFTFFLSLIPKRLIFANRFGAGHNFGSFEFYQAQYLGTEDNLRGYRKYRFAGRTKAYNNAEIRLRLANFRNYLFPGSLGFHAFIDAGRVWNGSNSNIGSGWATGYGGGFWISPFQRIVVTFTYAASKEDKMPLVGVGWKF
jgi:hypothetical protein